jgi:hypothetical protein
MLFQAAQEEEGPRGFDISWSDKDYNRGEPFDMKTAKEYGRQILEVSLHFMTLDGGWFCCLGAIPLKYSDVVTFCGQI